MKTHRTLLPLALAGADGRFWYTEARKTARRIARSQGVPLSRVCALLSLFSPRVSVTRSITWTIHYLSTGLFAHDCTRGHRAAVHHWEKTGVIRGPKTSAFYAALMGDLSSVVLDTWMARAMNVPERHFKSPVRYRHAASRIHRVAALLSWPPAEVQAAIWTATLRHHRRNPPRISSLKPTSAAVRR